MTRRYDGRTRSGNAVCAVPSRIVAVWLGPAGQKTGGIFSGRPFPAPQGKHRQRCVEAWNGVPRRRMPSRFSCVPFAARKARRVHSFLPADIAGAIADTNRPQTDKDLDAQRKPESLSLRAFRTTIIWSCQRKKRKRPVCCAEGGLPQCRPQRRRPPELLDRRRRRTFTAQTKLRVLAETDGAADVGLGTCSRREVAAGPVQAGDKTIVDRVYSAAGSRPR
jgi:hypothetical protein